MKNYTIKKNILTPNPLLSEVEWAIKTQNDGISPGCDKITVEMI